MKLVAALLFIVLFSNIQYAQGEIFKKYYDNGNLKESASLIGENEYRITTYHENGKLESERYVKDQELNGTWTAYDNNGNIVAIRQYNNGLKSGRWMVKSSGNECSYITEYDNDGLLVKTHKMDAYGNIVASR